MRVLSERSEPKHLCFGRASALCTLGSISVLTEPAPRSSGLRKTSTTPPFGRTPSSPTLPTLNRQPVRQVLGKQQTANDQPAAETGRYRSTRPDGSRRYRAWYFITLVLGRKKHAVGCIYT
ncbi:MAG TPA: hypothetical protein VE778_02505 [Candidatus Bathyarchaeia archaeon]|nr:hypothetical protein [Candidatus Bathyarchaeia archaeon]